jgi:deazaflavin-dependent oxidoreductase (nitroreductase family)
MVEAPGRVYRGVMRPPRAVLRLGWALHGGLFRATGGRLGTQPANGGLGTLFLLSTGRRSGAERRNAIFYIEDGPDFVVVASNAGADQEPAWWLNLQGRPDAEVEIAGDRIPVHARAATDAEATRLWPRLDARNPDYVAYRAKTSRPIAIVILERR